MDITKARVAFQSQRSSAKSRNVEWCFTFEQWLEWWGADIERRGRKYGQLQMQRVADRGPYAPENVRKGDAVSNAKTSHAVRRHRKAIAAQKEIFRAAMDAPSAPFQKRAREDWELIRAMPKLTQRYDTL